MYQPPCSICERVSTVQVTDDASVGMGLPNPLRGDAMPAFHVEAFAFVLFVCAEILPPLLSLCFHECFAGPGLEG